MFHIPRFFICEVANQTPVWLILCSQKSVQVCWSHLLRGGGSALNWDSDQILYSSMMFFVLDLFSGSGDPGKGRKFVHSVLVGMAWGLYIKKRGIPTVSEQSTLYVSFRVLPCVHGCSPALESRLSYWLVHIALQSHMYNPTSLLHRIDKI